MLEGVEADALAANIKAHGLHEPIWLHEGRVLDGRNRLRACLAAHVEPRWRTYTGDSPTAFAVSANIVRRHLDDGARAFVGAKLKPMFEAEAKQRQVAGGGDQKSAAKKSVRANLPEAIEGSSSPALKPLFEAEAKQRQVVAGVHGAEGGRGNRKPERLVANLPGVSDAPLDEPSSRPAARPREQAAAVMSVSARSVQDAQRVLEHGSPELIHAGEQGKIAVSAAAKLSALPHAEQARIIARVASGEIPAARIIGTVKLEAKRALAEEIRANPIITPEGRYQVIVVDPPWKYDSRAEDTTHRGKNLYPDMTVEEICALPVAALAQPNCVLWLWTTNAFMRGAYQCLDAWGFHEKTILTWDKELLGLGDWLRNVTEHCILAVRGKPIVSLTNQTTMLRERRREHSRKPDGFYSLVEALCPGSKVEMFSRTNREGWAAWGAEAGKFDAPHV